MFAMSRKYWSQFIAVYTASLGPIANGMEFGWASPAVPILSSKDSPVYIDHDNSFWVQSLYIIGGVCAIPVTFSCLQYLGRKKSLLLAECVTFVCWILIATASSIEQLFVARFVGGMAANMIFVGLPMYTAEVAEPTIRGFLGSFVYTQSIFGVLLSYSIVPFVPIWASSALAASLSLLMIGTFMWQPESPYFLLLNGQKDAGRRELERLRSSAVDEELKEMCAAVERQASERGRPIDLLLVASNRKAVVIMSMLNSGQNLAGMTVVTMNVQTILQRSATAGGGAGALSSELAAILFGVTMVVSTLLGSLLIDHFGRKLLVISSSLIASLFIALLGGFFYVKECMPHLVELSGCGTWLPLFATLAYAFAFKCGMGLVPIIVTGELFPTSVKSMGMVLSDLCFTVMATLSIQLYYVTSDLYAIYVPFFIFAFFGLCTAIFVAVYMPETKGKSLEQIQIILKGQP